MYIPYMEIMFICNASVDINGELLHKACSLRSSDLIAADYCLATEIMP